MDTQQTTQIEQETEIDLMELAGVLLRHIKLLAICFLAGAILAAGGTKLLITPQYTSTSLVYIYTKTTSITSLADLQIGSQLAVDFQTLATSRPVVEKVISSLRLDTTYEKLLGSMTISNPSNTRILKISVDNPDPKLAADISNAMAESISDRIAEVMSTDKPFIAETAIPAEHPSSPSVGRNTAIGALLGLVAAAAFVLIRYFMDDTIKTADDVEKYLQLNTLASIPLEHTQDKNDKKKHTSGRGKSSAHHARTSEHIRPEVRTIRTGSAIVPGAGSEHSQNKAAK